MDEGGQHPSVAVFVLLEVGWLLIKPRVIEHTGGRLGSVWTDTGLNRHIFMPLARHASRDCGSALAVTPQITRPG